MRSRTVCWLTPGSATTRISSSWLARFSTRCAVHRLRNRVAAAVEGLVVGEGGVGTDHGIDVLVDPPEQIGERGVHGVGEDERPGDEADPEGDRQSGEHQAQLVSEYPLEADPE